MSSLFTIPPLDKLISFAPFLKCLNVFFEIKSFVSSTNGT